MAHPTRLLVSILVLMSVALPACDDRVEKLELACIESGGNWIGDANGDGPNGLAPCQH